MIDVPNSQLMFRSMKPSRSTALASLALLAAGLAGCGGSDRLPVTGQLLRDDGSPLVAARVTARSDKTGKWATADTDAEGRFELATTAAGEGLPAGEYYVIVVEYRGGLDSPAPATIHPKYADPGSSGLSVKVAPGQTAELNARLDPPTSTASPAPRRPPPL
jgi:hypothetical protein